MKNFLKIILAAGVFVIFGAAQANAQSDFAGKYALERKTPNGQTTQISFELKSGGAAIYSKINPSLEQSEEKTGSWNWNESKKRLTVVIPAAEAGETEVVVTFKPSGRNLKVVAAAPPQTGKIGDVFRKI